MVTPNAVMSDRVAGRVVGVGEHPEPRLREPRHERDQRGLVTPVIAAPAAGSYESRDGRAKACWTLDITSSRKLSDRSSMRQLVR